ncbi:MAG: hypothetical protein ACTSP9_16320 [Promethearchaeota archaeon]
MSFAVVPMMQSAKSSMIPFALKNPLKLPDSWRICGFKGITWNQ